MTRSTTALLAIAVLVFSASAGFAAGNHRASTDSCLFTNDGRVICRAGQRHALARSRMSRHSRSVQRRAVRASLADSSHTVIIPHPAGCPRVAFCACGASVRVFGRRIKELYRAAAWFRFPRTAPAPGMVAVRQHHVFTIEEVLGSGMVLATDFNSGRHLSRRHVVSLRGYRVVDPHGSRWASR